MIDPGGFVGVMNDILSKSSPSRWKGVTLVLVKSEGVPVPTKSTMIPTEEMESVLRMHRDKDQRMGYVSRLLQRSLVANLASVGAAKAAEETIERKKCNNKPIWVPGNNSSRATDFAHFNVSHDNDAVVMGVSHHLPVGVDIMKICIPGNPYANFD
eukprot:GHVU01096410.1.p1 GENE.GHVU01096410.1~~GHVU01096410.1.p1  ORF type:complete len:169 (-),score=27.98 GHVU01096410.1:1761-2228(-)